MTVAAKTAFGNSLWMAPDGSAVVKIAELISLNPPKLSRDTMDVTTHDSPAGAQEVIAAGTYSPGEISGQIHYIAGSPGDDAMLAAMTGGGLHDFKIVVKSGAGTEDQTCSGYVTEYGPDDMAPDGKQTASFSIKVSGPITQVPTV